MPRGIRKSVVTTDDIATQEQGITLMEGAEGVEIHRDDIEVVQPQQMRSMAEDEKFMSEFVVIFVESDDDPNSPVFLYAGHNGTPQWVQRGTEQRIRRKFLYSLIAGKKSQFACAFGRDNNGNEFNRLSPSTRTTYRLSVIQDSREGMKKFSEWMRES